MFILEVYIITAITVYGAKIWSLASLTKLDADQSKFLRKLLDLQSISGYVKIRNISARAGLCVVLGWLRMNQLGDVFPSQF